MQYFTDNGFLLIGSNAGKHFKKLSKSYLQWAKDNLPEFSDQLHKARKRQRKANDAFRANHSEPWKVQLPKPVNDMPARTKRKRAKRKLTFSKQYQPKPKQFTSRATRQVGATLDG